MTYKDYLLIVDLLDEYQKEREFDYRRAINMGAKYEDVFPSLRSEQVRIHDVKKMLKDCILSYAKEKQPDNIELHEFWNPKENKLTNEKSEVK